MRARVWCEELWGFGGRLFSTLAFTREHGTIAADGTADRAEPAPRSIVTVVDGTYVKRALGHAWHPDREDAERGANRRFTGLRIG
jgi:hypothetical protein